MSLTDRLKEYFAPSPDGVRVRDVVREIPGAFADVGKEIFQGTNRSVASLGISAGNAPTQVSNILREKLGGTKVPNPFESRIQTDQSPATRFMFGGKDILDVPETGKYIAKEIKDTTGVEVNPTLTPFLGFGGRVVDILPGDKTVKEGLNLTRESMEEILKTKNVERIKQIMLSTGQVDVKDAENISAALKNVKTEKEFNRVTDVMKERGFVKSVKKAVPEADKVAGSYIPRSTDELSMKAANLIKEDIYKAEEIAMNNTDENAVAIASELIKKYSDDAEKAVSQSEKNSLYDKVADIVNTMAPKLTELGRAVQAASILGRMTPEGQLRFAAKTIENYNKTARTKIPGLTRDQVEYFSKEARDIFKLPDGEEKAMRYQKMQQDIQDLVPTPLWKKLTTIWKAGLLTGIKTSGLNIASNLSHSAAEAVKDIPAAAVDSVASLFTGKRTSTATLRGTPSGLKKGFNKGFRYLKTGFDERNMANKLEYNHINFGKGPVGKLAQAYTDTVFRVIGSQDQPFYYGALSRSLYDQSLAQAYNLGYKGKAAKEYAQKLAEDPSEEMVTGATMDALTAVFQNKTLIGEKGEAFRNILGPVGEAIMPFVRTPSSVAMQIINYSPVGAIKAIAENVGKGRFNQRAFSKAMGRSITGTVPLYLGYKLYQNDMVSLEYPDTERERNLWEAEGRKDNSIKVDGKWREPTVLGPAGNLVLLGAYYARGLKKAGSASYGMYEGIKDAAGGGLDALKQQTFLTGVNSFVEAFNDPTRFGETYISGLVSSIVPTIFSDVAKATDPLERRAQGVSERVQSRIPGARQGLEPKVDVLGREVKAKGNPLEIMIDPTRPLPDTSTPVIRELRRLQDAGNPVSPTKLGDKNGFAVLSPEQNTRLWERAGELTNTKLSALMNHPGYKKADDADRAASVKKISEQVQVVARAEMVISLTQGLQGPALVAKLKELRRDPKFLNQDVYRKYLELR